MLLKLICKIRYCKRDSDMHLSQILTGFKLLEKQEKVKLEIISDCYDFRNRGLYEHNAIVEVEILDKILVYDMADGYQSIHRKDVFDRQLDRIDFYFKRSYNSEFHKDMKNFYKIKPFGLNYYCTCINNPFDIFKWNFNIFSFSSMRKFLAYLRGEKKWLKLCDYKNFEGNRKFDSYNILFFTRIWDSTSVNIDKLRITYPYFSEEELHQEVNKWKKSLEEVTEYRIKLIRRLKYEFGERFLGGVEKSDLAYKLCPDLIIEDQYTSKENFMKLIKSNYVCIATVGLHNSTGWKMAEYVAAGRAILTEPLFYETTGKFSEGNNYLVFHNIEECINRSHLLLNNIQLIHQIEDNNVKYYNSYLSPDKIIENTLVHII